MNQTNVATPEMLGVIQSGMELDVSCDLIRPLRGQPRQYFNRIKLKELEMSIAVVGQLQPGTVRYLVDTKKGEPMFELIDGERRWTVLKRMGMKMRVVIREVKNSADQFLRSAVSNFGREDHQPLEIAYALARIQKEHGFTQEQLGKIFGKSQGWANQHLGLLKLTPEVHALMHPDVPDGRRIKFMIAITLIPFPPDEQNRLAREVSEGKMSMTQGLALIRQRSLELDLRGVKLRVRTPNRDFNILSRFVTNLREDTNVILDITAPRFQAMFNSRSRTERQQMLRSIRECQNLLAQLEQHVERSISPSGQLPEREVA